MRKWLSMLLALALATMLIPAGLAENTPGGALTQITGTTTHTVEQKTVTIYMYSMDAWQDINLYFLDGVEDLPWLELSEFADFYAELRRNLKKDTNCNLTFTAQGDVARLTRESDYFMEVDFAKDTIYFNDFDAFQHNARESALLDLVSEPGFDAEGQEQLIHRVNGLNFDRYGFEIELPLSDYGIDIIHQDDGYYIPMQTLSDFLVAPSMQCNLMFNGETAFLGNRGSLGIYDYDLTPMGEYYYSVDPAPRSEALTRYGYSELCLMLDNLYGLKDAHNIQSFNQFFYQMGMDDDLLNPDPLTADNALNEFISLHLDDLHSSFLGYSPCAGGRGIEGGIGLATIKSDQDIYYYKSVREKYYPNGAPFYEEVGNTAYITFDSFDSDFFGEAFYNAVANGEDIPGDTIGNIILAHNQIYRQDSPVENVVIDLSCNGGGDVDAAVFLQGWIEGDATFSVNNTFTGAQSTAVYRVDVNLDRKFDRGDEVDDKNVYCLISPNSFSCGNLVPMAFKSSQRVRLLGNTSGGGSCIVQQMSTAWGAYFTISSPNRMSFLKNGSFYDIDRGVEPDYTIDKIDHYYDREALTDYINNLF